MSRTTIRDVADAAGVSIATVSRVLNDRGGASATARTVREAADRLGYAPNALARMLITQKSMTVALLQPVLSSSYAGEVLAGVERAAHELGYSVVICSTGGRLTRLAHYVRLMASRQVDAAIVMSTEVTPEHHALFTALALPYVVIAGTSPAEDVPVFAVDDHQATYDATGALLGAGHRRIAMIAGQAEDRIAGSPRVRGFVAACDAAGIDPADRPVVHGDFLFDRGCEAMRELLDRHPGFTAVVTASDETAVAVLSVAAERGLRVPDDISVIGFDALPVTRMTNPPLVSVEQPLREMGYQAMQAAERLVRGETVPKIGAIVHRITDGRSIRTR